MSTTQQIPARESLSGESELLAWRPQFPILETATYLISNSLGAMPRAVHDALSRYADIWAERGVTAWESDWWMLPQRVADGIAPILGAAPGTVSTHQNVTLASAVAASCFDFSSARNGIVCSELHFPSIVQLYRQQERHGAKLHVVASPDGFTVPTEAMVQAIDESTRLVAISHVIFRSGYVQDIEAITERAHAVGAHVLLDIYQSGGIMPIDLGQLGVDMAVGGVLKWLCGGPGVAYLYVRPDLIGELQPALTGWFARGNAFAFDPYDESWRDDAWRFLNGTTHIPSLSAAEPGLEILGKLDMRQVRAKSLRQTGLLIEAAQERGWRVNTPVDPQRRGGHVVVDFPGAEQVSRQLLQRRVMIDHRPGAGIRLAPHFYNTDAELDVALAAMDELVAAL